MESFKSGGVVPSATEPDGVGVKKDGPEETFKKNEAVRFGETGVIRNKSIELRIKGFNFVDDIVNVGIVGEAIREVNTEVFTVRDPRDGSVVEAWGPNMLFKFGVCTFISVLGGKHDSEALTGVDTEIPFREPSFSLVEAKLKFESTMSFVSGRSKKSCIISVKKNMRMGWTGHVINVYQE